MRPSYVTAALARLGIQRPSVGQAAAGGIRLAYHLELVEADDAAADLVAQRLAAARQGFRPPVGWYGPTAAGVGDASLQAERDGTGVWKIAGRTCCYDFLKVVESTIGGGPMPWAGACPTCGRGFRIRLTMPVG